jgi:cytosine/adenosine deaminase-related metal-dependent hydrolase
MGGARALGIEDKIGSIEVGKLADIILVNLMNANIGPSTNDLVSNIVYYANGSDVETVIVDGHILKDQGVVKVINEEQVMYQALKTNEDLWTKFYEEYPELKNNT